MDKCWGKTLSAWQILDTKIFPHQSLLLLLSVEASRQACAVDRGPAAAYPIDHQRHSFDIHLGVNVIGRPQCNVNAEDQPANICSAFFQSTVLDTQRRGMDGLHCELRQTTGVDHSKEDGNNRMLKDAWRQQYWGGRRDRILSHGTNSGGNAFGTK